MSTPPPMPTNTLLPGDASWDSLERQVFVDDSIEIELEFADSSLGKQAEDLDLTDTMPVQQLRMPPPPVGFRAGDSRLQSAPTVPRRPSESRPTAPLPIPLRPISEGPATMPLVAAPARAAATPRPVTPPPLPPPLPTADVVAVPSASEPDPATRYAVATPGSSRVAFTRPNIVVRTK